MEWEGDPVPPQPRRRVGTVLVVVVGLVAWFARSPATTPQDLVVDPATSAPQASEPEDPLEELGDLATALPLRPGTWQPEPLPPSLAGLVGDTRGEPPAAPTGPGTAMSWWGSPDPRSPLTIRCAGPGATSPTSLATRSCSSGLPRADSS